jgi:hypothetical protein
VLAVLALSLAAAAQTGRSGLVGTAVDEAGQPVADAELTLAPKGETASRVQVLKTDKRGRFQNRFLTSGQYLLDVKDRRSTSSSPPTCRSRMPAACPQEYDMVNHPKTGMAAIPVQAHRSPSDS